MSRLTLESGPNDVGQMAQGWLQRVNGKHAQLKLPACLQACIEKCMQSRRAEEAMKGMKAEVEKLKSANVLTQPSPGDDEAEGVAMGKLGGSDADEASGTAAARSAAVEPLASGEGSHRSNGLNQPTRQRCSLLLLKEAFNHDQWHVLGALRLKRNVVSDCKAGNKERRERTSDAREMVASMLTFAMEEHQRMERVGASASKKAQLSSTAE